MDEPLESLVLKEISQAKKKKYCRTSLTCGLYKDDTNLQKHIHRLSERAYNCWWEGWGKGIVREFGMDLYTPLYLNRIINKDLLCSAWNSAQCFVAV